MIHSNLEFDLCEACGKKLALDGDASAKVRYIYMKNIQGLNQVSTVCAKKRETGTPDMTG